MLMKILAFVVLLFCVICIADFVKMLASNTDFEDVSEKHTVIFGGCVIVTFVTSMLLALLTII